MLMDSTLHSKCKVSRSVADSVASVSTLSRIFVMRSPSFSLSNQLVMPCLTAAGTVSFTFAAIESATLLGTSAIKSRAVCSAASASSTFLAAAALASATSCAAWAWACVRAAWAWASAEVADVALSCWRERSTAASWRAALRRCLLASSSFWLSTRAAAWAFAA